MINHIPSIKKLTFYDVDAQYNIGVILEHGVGPINIDLIQALFWYRKAAAQGDQDAMEAVERLS